MDAVLLKTWSNMGLVKAKRVSVYTTAQPKNSAYPTAADLLHRVRETIVTRVKRVPQEIPLQKPFRSFTRVSKKPLLRIKKVYRNNPTAWQVSLKELQKR